MDWNTGPYDLDNLPIPVWELKDGTREADLKAGVRSPEELAKYTLDPNLSEMDRWQKLLKGLPVQRKAGIAMLSNMVGLSDKNVSTVVTTVRRLVMEWAPEQQLQAASCLARLLAASSVSVEVASAATTGIVEGVLLQEISDAVFDAFMPVLDVLVPSSQKPFMLDQLVPLSLKLGYVGESSQSRRVSAELFGRMCAVLTEEEITGTFLPNALMLCQDTHLQVRRCMGGQITALAHALGVEKTTETLLPELKQLLDDEEVEVRTQAFQSLVDLLDFLPTSTQKDPGVRWLEKSFKDPDAGMRTRLAQLLGVVAVKLGRIFPSQPPMMRKSFSDLYWSLSNEKSGEEVRRYCAWNLPALTLVTGPMHFASSLRRALDMLAADPSVEVRHTCAFALIEVAAIINQADDLRLLGEVTITLLKDDEKKVQRSMLKALPAVLGAVAALPIEQQSPLFKAVQEAVLQADHTAGFSWRFRQDLLVAVKHLPRLFLAHSMSALYIGFLPLIFKHIRDGAQPVKTAAAEALCQFLRHEPVSTRRADLCARIIRELAQSTSYCHRLQFMAVAGTCAATFSRRWFKKNLLPACMSLSQDAVADVRASFCRLLPVLSAMLKPFSGDVDWADQLGDAARFLKLDKNKHVKRAAQQAVGSAETMNKGKAEEDEERDKLLEAEEDLQASAELLLLMTVRKSGKKWRIHKAEEVGEEDSLSQHVAKHAPEKPDKQDKSSTKLLSGGAAGRSPATKAGVGRSIKSKPTQTKAPPAASRRGQSLATAEMQSELHRLLEHEPGSSDRKPPRSTSGSPIVTSARAPRHRRVSAEKESRLKDSTSPVRLFSFDKSDALSSGVPGRPRSGDDTPKIAQGRRRNSSRASLHPNDSIAGKPRSSNDASDKAPTRRHSGPKESSKKLPPPRHPPSSGAARTSNDRRFQPARGQLQPTTGDPNTRASIKR